ncbi:Sulfhydrogenase 1 subunit gamma [uncultured archaeon]|nr:Sulfhydrogenase 1 subunit gamma [uncultured archaeon]
MKEFSRPYGVAETRPVTIKKVVNECANVKTFILDCQMKAQPGQFGMLLVPAVDERPMSFSNVKGDVSFTVKSYGGEYTKKLFALKKGDLVGVRGPYGKGFKIGRGPAVFVAGGIGVTPLLPLTKAWKGDVTVILGAKTSKELCFKKELKKHANIIITTDDGSEGTKTFPHLILEETLTKTKAKNIAACGPEPMMNAIMDIGLSMNIPTQLSLERIMTCATGFCGQCTLDPSGLRVCADGPVFDANDLVGTEFGVYHRDKTGVKHYFRRK